jgi:hypothetical protein
MILFTCERERSSRSCHEGYRGRRGKTPLIFNLDTTRTWVMNSTPRQYYPFKKRRYSLDRKLTGPHKVCEHSEEREKPLATTGIRAPERSARNLRYRASPLFCPNKWRQQLQFFAITAFWEVTSYSLVAITKFPRKLLAFIVYHKDGDSTCLRTSVIILQYERRHLIK